MTPPRAVISTFESDSFRPNSRNRYRLGPCVLATESQEAYDPKSLFSLEKDWDFLLQIGKPEATVQPGASGRPDDNSGFLSGLDRNSGSLLQFGKPKATARRGAMGSLHDNLATNYREAYNPEFLSVLERDLDSSLQIGKPEATACRGATGSLVNDSAIDRQEADNLELLPALEDLDSFPQTGQPEATARREAMDSLGNNSELDQDAGPSLDRDNSPLTTSTLENRFKYWKGRKLSDLFQDEDQLVTYLEPLPF